jgi:hypothetical protein
LAKKTNSSWDGRSKLLTGWEENYFLAERNKLHGSETNYSPSPRLGETNSSWAENIISFWLRKRTPPEIGEANYSPASPAVRKKTPPLG